MGTVDELKKKRKKKKDEDVNFSDEMIKNWFVRL